MILAERKIHVRRTAALAVAALEESEKRCADRSIAAALHSLDAYRASTQLLAYRPLPDEVDIVSLTDDAAREGKAVFLPAASEDGELHYRRWFPGDELVLSTLGVHEPIGGDPPGATPSLVLVPGRVFSVDGWRVGRGGGYYDRALSSLSRLGTTVGVAYSCQVVAHVPHGPGDERVHFVLSELGVGEGATRAVARNVSPRS